MTDPLEPTQELPKVNYFDYLNLPDAERARMGLPRLQSGPTQEIETVQKPYTYVQVVVSSPVEYLHAEARKERRREALIVLGSLFATIAIIAVLWLLGWVG